MHNIVSIAISGVMVAEDFYFLCHNNAILAPMCFICLLFYYIAIFLRIQCLQKM